MRLLGLGLAVLWVAPALAAEPVVGVGDAAAQVEPAHADGPRLPGPNEPGPAPMHDTAVEPGPTEPGPAAPARETTVVGERHDEETLVGAYRQPKWTDRRRFPGVRLYVAPPGTATAEFWLETKTPIGSDARIRTMYELSFGLGHRLQLDLYLRTQSEGTGPMEIESERVELRWAFADWGVLPGNPTLYLEWIRQTSGPNKAELKLLLGGALGHRVFWGVNLFFERELWGFDQAHEYGATAGLTWSLLDSELSLGGEARVELVDTRTSRFSPLGVELLVGPTVSWRPVPSAHLLLVWYVGPELERADSAASLAARFVMQPTLVGGWRF